VCGFLQFQLPVQIKNEDTMGPSRKKDTQRKGKIEEDSISMITPKVRLPNDHLCGFEQ